MELIHRLLLDAIAGENSAEANYRRAMTQALSENLTGVASLFSALARAEAIHSANHIRALRKNGFADDIPPSAAKETTGSTRDNLERAVINEAKEFKSMYPSFTRQIHKKYGNSFEAKIALLSMKWAEESEKEHYKLLMEAHDCVLEGRDMSNGSFFLCTVCGNLHYQEKAPLTLCPICGHDIAFYLEVRTEDVSI